MHILLEKWIRQKRFYLLIVLTICMLGCSRHNNFAPVVELKWRTAPISRYSHQVSKGETLYSIAFRYDKDYRYLAALNHIGYPYIVKVGQRIQISRPAPRPRQNKRQTKLPANYKYKRPAPVRSSGGSWIWPARGRVVTNFLPQQGKKGIDIAGKKGDLVKAAASGVVAYAGAGLSGYGNLIIIKHNGQFLTAYGNNLANRVREGQVVKAGQIIADMGIVERKYWGVHFEIRKSGQPVNPLRYLRR